MIVISEGRSQSAAADMKAELRSQKVELRIINKWL